VACLKPCPSKQVYETASKAFSVIVWSARDREVRLLTKLETTPPWLKPS
jgi:hypothetical protein